MKKSIVSLVEAWSKRSLRERQFIVAGAAIVAIATIVSIDEWQRREHKRLNRSLPALESRLSHVQLMADEIRLLGGATRIDSKLTATAEQLSISAKAKGMTLEITKNGSAQLVVKGIVPFDDLSTWLGTIASQGWHVERADIIKESGSVSIGLARVDIALATGS